MHRGERFLPLLMTALLWVYLSPAIAFPSDRQTLIVSPEGPYTRLADALTNARDGETIEVHGGTHAGPLIVDKRVTLVGRDWPVIEGGNRGTVVKLTTAGVRLQGFVIRNSGRSLDAENSGVAVEAPDAVVENNRLQATLFGIYLRKAPRSLIRGNVIQSKELPVPRRGDAIRVWYSNHVRIEQNIVEKGRDVVLWYSENLHVLGNTVERGRYGLHFMYCDDALIQNNRLIHNSVGAFLMYSRRMHLRHNTIAYNRGPSGYGVGLKDMDDAVVEENLFLDNRVGAFVDNSPREIDSTGLFRGNFFAFNDTGVSLLPAVQRNRFVNNSFVDNQEQIGIMGGGRLIGNQWTVAGRGNYWSDYVGYDADRDGLGDVPYRADRLFENLLDRYPTLRLLAHGPAVQAIDFAARTFPLVKPQAKLIDTRPLMTPAMPKDVPLLARASSRPLGIVSASLLLLAMALALLPRLPNRHRAVLRTAPLASGDTAMVHVQQLRKRFGSLVAVDRLSFDIAPGEAVALWGRNGAGKTTVLRCVLGLLPFAGSLQVGGYDVRLQGKEARRLIGFVPQELNLHDDLTIRETMRFYARLKKVPFDAIVPLLQRLELAEHVHKPVRDLSGGMKQRLALAVALLADPPLFVLDEPTANLDARARETFLTLLAGLKATGKTLVFSSHRLEEVAHLADRILVLERGKLLVDSPPSELGKYLGWKATLRLKVAGDSIETAIATLIQHGFSARNNGKGIRVEVAPDEKGVPISLLVQARIPVHDFEVEQLNEEASDNV